MIARNDSRRQEALRYAAMGLYVFPCQNKKPLTSNGFKDATRDADQIDDSWTRHPDAQIGIRTGECSGLFVLDLDVKPDGNGVQQFAEIDPTEMGVEGFEQTPIARTPSGGRHLYFTLPADLDIGCRTKLAGLQIDIRGEGGYVIAPNSEGYVWEQSPFDLAIMDSKATNWLLEFYRTGKLPNVNGYRETNGTTFEVPHTLASHPGEVEGARNAKLCQLVGGHLAEHGLDNDLLPMALEWGARCTPPLPEDQIQRSVQALAEKHAKALPAKVHGIILRPYDTIEPKDVEWLWPGRIALGKLTIIAGNPGLGKTFLCLDIAATVSTGSCFSDGARAPFGKVVICSLEDAADDTLRPRLDALGADVANVVNLEGVRRPDGTVDQLSLQKHITALSAALDLEPDIRLIIIDPISGVLGDTDSHNNASVRAVLVPLVSLAEKHSVAVLGISHFSKAMQQAGIHRTLGSVAFVATARATWAVEKDRDDPDRRLFLPVKNNLAATKGLAFRLRDDRVEWESGEIDVDLDSLGDGSSEPDNTALDEAKSWLLAYLSDGPVASKTLFQDAKADGHSCRTIKRAKAALGIKSAQIDGKWRFLPPGDPSDNGQLDF